MKKMPPPVRNNPTVRGAKGKPNIKPVDKGKHVEAHSSPPGDYYPGGNYNRDYDKAVGDFDELTPERAREIADKCMEKYFE